MAVAQRRMNMPNFMLPFFRLSTFLFIAIAYRSKTVQYSPFEHIDAKLIVFIISFQIEFSAN